MRLLLWEISGLELPRTHCAKRVYKMPRRYAYYVKEILVCNCSSES
jgi:hypothetical protein